MSGALDPRILLVEDEPELNAIIVECLSGAGIAVHSCANGQVALTALAQDQFDLVLSDIQMPELTGTDLLKEMRRRGDLTPVVFLTSYGDRDATLTALKLGAVDFLEKPTPPATLVERVFRALDIVRREQGEKTATDRRLIGLLRSNNLKRH